LSICYGIVKEHGGEILARNREEGGATIEVRLLASDKPAMVETTPPKRRESLLAGRVLLVEDEARCWIWNAMFWPAREPRLRLPRAQRTCSNGSARRV